MVMILGPNGETLAEVPDGISALEQLALASVKPAMVIPPVVELEGPVAASAAVIQVVAKKVQRCGRDHSPKTTKDTTTGIVYKSESACGRAVAATEGLDAKNKFVFFALATKYPGRFVRV